MVRGKVTRPGHAGKEGKLVVRWAEDERLTSVRDSLSPLCLRRPYSGGWDPDSRMPWVGYLTGFFPSENSGNVRLLEPVFRWFK